MVSFGSALCVPGNHDMKLLKKLRGRDVQVTHGLEQTLAELALLPAADLAPFTERAAAFLDGLVSHYVLDGGSLVIAFNIVAADHVENNIGALAAGGAFRDLDEVLGLIVNGDVGTELARRLAFFRAAGGDDDARAESLGELDRGRSNP